MKNIFIGLIVLSFFLFLPVVHAKEICGGTGQHDLNNLMSPILTCNGQPVYQLTSQNRQKIEQRLELQLNNALNAYDMGKLSYKITQAVIMGKDGLEIAASVVEKLPGSGLAINVPGLFEMKLRYTNGQLGWVVDGSLVRFISGMGFVQMSRDQTF